jgi:hypothetical protein
MPIPTTTEEKPLIPKGTHIVILREVVEKDVNSQYSNREDGKVTKWMWKFESTTLDEKDEPYELVQFTNTSYGSSSATLTKLLDQMVPGIDIDRAATFDTDTLIGKRFEATIKHEPNAKNEKRPYVVLEMIQPVQRKSKQKEDDFGD